MALFGGWRITRTGILFIIGVVILLAAVIGGIIWLRERSEQVRRDEAIKVAEQNLEDQSNVIDNPIAVDTSTTQIEQPQQSSSNQPTATELPTTGTEANAIVVIALLSLAAGYYVTSRRAVRQL